MRGLIVNADDLGQPGPVTDRILDAHARGIVTSTTLMVCAPAAREAARRAAREAPRLALGLHVDVTSTCPGGGLAFVVALGSIDPGDVEEEVEAQIAAFHDVVGRAPDHLDVHQHVLYLAPGGLAAFLAVARRHGLPVRSPAPFVSSITLEAFFARVERENGVALAAHLPPARELAPALDAVWRASGVRAPGAFVHEHYGPAATAEALAARIHALPVGVTEVMCHPGADGEVAALTDPAVRRAVEDAGVRLMTFGEVS